MIVKTSFAGEVRFDAAPPTLKQALIEVGERVKFPLCSAEDTRVRGDFTVSVNGEEYENLEGGINAPLSDDDEVEVTMVVLAGG